VGLSASSELLVNSSCPEKIESSQPDMGTCIAIICTGAGIEWWQSVSLWKMCLQKWCHSLHSPAVFASSSQYSACTLRFWEVNILTFCPFFYCIRLLVVQYFWVTLTLLSLFFIHCGLFSAGVILDVCCSSVTFDVIVFPL